jgi:hypothetical protein
MAMMGEMKNMFSATMHAACSMQHEWNDDETLF